jgi:hypothetical protein
MTIRIRIHLLALALLEHFNWELFDHPPYSPDLALSDYKLKSSFGLQRFSTNDELTEDLKTWLSTQEADFFDTGVQNLIPDKSALILAVTTLRSS